MGNSIIPYGRQNINDDDIDAVVSILRSDWLTQGPAVEKFERVIADYCHAKYAVAVNSATSALHISCLAAGLSQGDSLWTSPNTFVASANCALYCGANPDFVDINPCSYNLDADSLEKKLVSAQAQGKLPRIVVPVHFAGQPCEMEHIAVLADRFGFNVIEDASHALGGRYRGSKIGSCQYSSMTVFSFHPVKNITTGEGGMVLTNCSQVYDRLVRLRSHGITRNPAMMVSTSCDPWYYEQIELGFNYRMTDFQAALGISQMNRLDEFIARRQHLAKRYDEGLQGLPIVLPWQNQDDYSAQHLYVIRIRNNSFGLSRRDVFDRLRQSGINVNVHYIPVHTQPYYRQKGFQFGDFPQAEHYYSEALTLPLYTSLSENDQDYVIREVRNLFL